MKIKERIHKEKKLREVTSKGYSRSMANAWFQATERDIRLNKKYYKVETIEKLHERGYLVPSIKRYDLNGKPALDYITDFDYIRLKPFNSSYSKWLEDILTTNRVLKNCSEYCREVYYSLIRRDGKTLILRVGQEDREYRIKDLFDTVREKGVLELRPAFWASEKPRYTLEYRGDKLYVGGVAKDERVFRRTIEGLTANYVLAEKVTLEYFIGEDEKIDHSLKLWIANDSENGPAVLFGVMNVYWNEGAKKVRKSAARAFDVDEGWFEFEDRVIQIPDWDKVRENLLTVSAELKPLSFYSCTIAMKGDGKFKFLHFSGSPRLPEVAFNAALNDYLLGKVEVRNTAPKLTWKDRWTNFKSLLFNKFVEKYCRKGIRPYMQKLWFESVKSDFLNTKDVSLGKKIWCWKRGFMSYRTYQYGLTEENYTTFLSDYDYHYLNRINNDYQKWINDKTTTRLILEPFKEYIPAYYLLIFKRNRKMEISRMWDCPENIEGTVDGLLQLLREKGKLAMKPSAGTHGDGFYCLSFENDVYSVNGEAKTKEEIEELLESFKSFYLVTEYIEMHSKLKEIYSQSVNTVRMMVINREGYNPQIMQTYMRIGSSKTGFTDNVGYGGICVMVNKDTGELYQPETISEHKFYDCPHHPDTGTPIAGFLPNWDIVCEKVKAVSRYLCELEYLGFDIAITEKGFCLLEINIHQDLHKVATHDEEIREFFREKIRRKKSMYGG